VCSSWCQHFLPQCLCYFFHLECLRPCPVSWTLTYNPSKLIKLYIFLMVHFTNSPLTLQNAWILLLLFYLVLSYIIAICNPGLTVAGVGNSLRVRWYWLNFVATLYLESWVVCSMFWLRLDELHCNKIFQIIS
jgi:hypothetical protein